MESELSFPPHIRGRRNDCPACRAIIGDNPHVADPAKVFDLCDHSGLNYHALGRVMEGATTVIPYVCQEPDCEGRAKSR
jgi:hypothetical protein